MTQPYPPQQPQPPQPTQQWQPTHGYPPAGPPRTPLSAPEPPKKRPLVAALVLGAVAVLGVLFVASQLGSTYTGTASTASTPTPSSCIGSNCGTPAGGGARPTTAAARTPVVLPPPAPAREITAREWAKIAKDPTAYVGQSIVVYGQVTQFDAATGTGGFRANVDGVKHQVSYGYADYETNTILTGSASTLSDLVDKDLFRAEVVVAGAYTYETTMGGQLTAPQLQVTKITVTGTAK